MTYTNIKPAYFSSFHKIVNGLADVVKLTKIYIPLTHSTKNRVLNDVREKVEEYSEKIGKETGIKLPDVRIKPYSDRLNDIFKLHLQKNKDKGSLNLTFLAPAILLYSIGKLYSMASEDMVSMIYEPRLKEQTIYVAFGASNKPDIILTGSLVNLDRDATHELSHHLWHTAGGKQTLEDLATAPFNVYKKWEEGFAMYCEAVRFKHLYPKKQHRKNLSFKGVYGKGFNLVSEVVEEHGEDVLMELPRNWRKFEHK